MLMQLIEHHADGDPTIVNNLGRLMTTVKKVGGALAHAKIWAATKTNTEKHRLNIVLL